MSTLRVARWPVCDSTGRWNIPRDGISCVTCDGASVMKALIDLYVLVCHGGLTFLPIPVQPELQ